MTAAMGPLLARAQYRRGRALERAGHWEAAARAYEAALAERDLEPEWHARLAAARARQRQWDAALKAYREALARDDRPARWHVSVGRVLERQRRWDEAQTAYGAALERDPKATELDRRLLADGARRFPARRRIAAFVSRNLEVIAKAAAREPRILDDARPRLFVYWGQGMAGAPPVVERCHREMLRHHDAAEVVVLDDRLIPFYADVPEHVLAKTAGNRTKFSDVLRLALLSRHGGVWLDATCFPRTRLFDVVPPLLERDFFAFRYPEGVWPSSWFLAARPDSYVLAMWREAQYRYWERFDKPIDYFFFHHLFGALYHLDDDFRASLDATPRLSARPPHRLQHAMHEPFEPAEAQRLLNGSFVHKLTYKYEPARVTPDSLLAWLLRNTPEPWPEAARRGHDRMVADAVSPGAPVGQPAGR